MQTTTNRRGALVSLAKAAAATGALSVACGVSQCTTKANAATIDRSAWDRAFAAMEVARKAHEAFKPTFDAALTGYYRAKPKGDEINLRPISPIVPPLWRADLLHSADLDKLHSDFVAGQGAFWGSPAPAKTIADHKACCDLIRQYRAEIQATKDRFRYDEMVERDDALSTRYYEAQDALFALPAPDLAALRWKLEHLFADGAADDGDGAAPWAQHVMANLMADVRRLLPKEA